MILSKPNQIKIYGHRGSRGDLPENTLESFLFLFENKINAFETDILISKDLIPVITHDFRLDTNMTKDSDGNWIKNENIKIYDLTYEEILKYDVGSINKLSRYGRRFLSQKSFPNVKEGDYVAITHVWAYGSTLSSNYNSRPTIAEIMVSGSKHKIIRKRQSLEDLVKN